jgi:hypothetical protein
MSYLSNLKFTKNMHNIRCKIKENLIYINKQTNSFCIEINK